MQNLAAEGINMKSWDRFEPMAYAALRVVAGALFAIPQTRAAILDLFRIGDVEGRRVETQPRAPVRPPLLGREVSLATAQRTVDFPLLVPAGPFTAYVDEPMVNVRWTSYVLSQWHGEQLPFAQKQVGPASQTAGVEVRGAPGFWITGARHEIVYRDPATDQIVAKSRRLAGNVLIWEAGDVTYRLEGAKTIADARAVARNLRAP